MWCGASLENGSFKKLSLKLHKSMLLNSRDQMNIAWSQSSHQAASSGGFGWAAAVRCLLLRLESCPCPPGMLLGQGRREDYPPPQLSYPPVGTTPCFSGPVMRWSPASHACLGSAQVLPGWAQPWADDFPHPHLATGRSCCGWGCLDTPFCPALSCTGGEGNQCKNRP